MDNSYEVNDYSLTNDEVDDAVTDKILTEERIDLIRDFTLSQLDDYDAQLFAIKHLMQNSNKYTYYKIADLSGIHYTSVFKAVKRFKIRVEQHLRDNGHIN
tara:strand:- start:161 stop:463 length:303 start_codon:yes stop_codon:yes gene_type:complete